MSYSEFFVELKTRSDNVTGNGTELKLYLPNGDIQIIHIDAGSFFEPGTKHLNGDSNGNSKDIRAIIITHAHIDHTGRLPVFLRDGYRKKIYTTKTTGNLMNIALKDSYSVMNKDKKNGNKATHTLEHVEMVHDRIKKVNFDEKIKVTKNIEFIFLKNAHLFGAAMVFVRCSYEGYKDINILFSGDYKEKNSFFKVPKNLPNRIESLPINVVLETTYGSSEDYIYEDIFRKEIMNSTERQNKILIPVNSLGKPQEILLKLKNMQDFGELPENYNIYCDGNLLQKYQFLAKNGLLGIEKNINYMPRNCTNIGNRKDMTANKERRLLLNSKEPFIMIASSGNASYGASNSYLRSMLERKDCSIIFTGYCPEETAGRILLDSQENEMIEIFGEVFIKKAKIAFTRQFSTHADCAGLINFLRKFIKLEGLILNHGSPESKKNFSLRVQEELGISSGKIDILESNKTTRIHSYFKKYC